MHPGYHTIISPLLTLRTDPAVPIPVGLIACQRDPLLRNLETTVVGSTIHSQPPEKKSGKKAVLAPTLPNEPILEVVLHDTVIFPEGGGQPTDFGEIITADGKSWPVIQCKRHGGHPVHYVKVSGIPVEDASAIFSSGTKVTTVLTPADWDRRYDHHLLSAVLETHFNLPTLSWSLTAYPAPCYVELPRGMKLEEISQAQNIVNQLVLEGRPVRIEVEELVKVPSEPSVASRAAGRGLPEDYTGGVNRVVIIEGVDRNPCCGTHLPSIHNLQLFILPQTEVLSRSASTTIRLYFLTGPRLIAYVSTSHDLLTKTASILSSGTSVVPERVGQLADERRKADKRVAEAEIELSTHLARDLINEMQGDNGVALFKKHLHRIEDPVNALGFLNAVQGSFTGLLEGQVASREFLVVLTSTPSAQTSSSVTVAVIFGNDEKQVKAFGDILKGMGIKGGGKGVRWSGKFIGAWRDDREGVKVKDALNRV